MVVRACRAEDDHMQIQYPRTVIVHHLHHLHHLHPRTAIIDAGSLWSAICQPVSEGTAALWNPRCSGWRAAVRQFRPCNTARPPAALILPSFTSTIN